MATRDCPVTQSDVAKAAGVSRGFVFQALSGGGRMGPATRAHIRETAQKLGYYPHSAAAELAGGHAKRLVLILPHLTNPYFDELSSHLRVAASVRGYSLIVMVSDLTRSSQVERDTIAEAVGMQPAGIIFIGTSQSTDDLVILSRRVTVCPLDHSVPDGTIWAVRIGEAAPTPPPHAREDALDVLGFERAYENYCDLLADPEVDAVSIASPNFLHHEIALAAIEAGKPFWIEKPMGVNAAQSHEIALAAHKAGLVSTVGFNYRHTPPIEYMRSLVRDGSLDRITNVRVWFIADYNSSPLSPLTWRATREKAGAGVVPDLMSHGADLAQYVVGRIDSVSAITDTFIKERPIPTKMGVGHSCFEIGDEVGPVENEDYVAAVVRFDNGAVGTLESSRVSVDPRAEYVVEVYGTQGSVRWTFERFNELEVCIGDGGPTHGYTRAMANPAWGQWAHFQPATGTSMGFDDMKVIEAQQFLSSIVTSTQLAPPQPRTHGVPWKSTRQW